MNIIAGALRAELPNPNEPVPEPHPPGTPDPGPAPPIREPIWKPERETPTGPVIDPMPEPASI